MRRLSSNRQLHLLPTEPIFDLWDILAMHTSDMLHEVVLPREPFHPDFFASLNRTVRSDYRVYGVEVAVKVLLRLETCCAVRGAASNQPGAEAHMGATRSVCGISRRIGTMNVRSDILKATRAPGTAAIDLCDNGDAIRSL
jgi:hypothetical protein